MQTCQCENFNSKVLTQRLLLHLVADLRKLTPPKSLWQLGNLPKCGWGKVGSWLGQASLGQGWSKVGARLGTVNLMTFNCLGQAWGMVGAQN